MEQESYTAEEASSMIFSDGLRIYSTLDQKAQSAMEQVIAERGHRTTAMLFPALWHEELVSLRDYPADTSSWDDVQYDESRPAGHQGRLRCLRRSSPSTTMMPRPN